MKLFEFQDYVAFIQSNIDQNKHIRAYKGKLAEASGCHRSFFSQVLNGHVHLTIDQAARLVSFWQLDDDETDYFIALVNLSRAGSLDLKKACERQLNTLRKKREDLAQRFKKPKLPSGPPEALYYSSWHWSAIHIIASIPCLRSAEKIAERLRLPIDFVHDTLTSLESLGLIRKERGQWLCTEKNLHLPKNSPLLGLHHSNWRSKAIESIHGHQDEALHYSAIHALSKRDIEKIKDIILDAIEKSRIIVEPSPEEEIACFNVDFFKL